MTGGTGNAFVLPCFSGTGRGMGGIGFGGVDFNFLDHPGPAGNCGGGSPSEFSRPRPFTFGLPQIVTVHMNAFVAEGPFLAQNAVVSWGGTVLFFDGSGNPISASFSLVPASVPKPSPWSLLSVGLMFFLALPIGGLRLRGRFHPRHQQ